MVCSFASAYFHDHLFVYSFTTLITNLALTASSALPHYRNCRKEFPSKMSFSFLKNNFRVSMATIIAPSMCHNKGNGLFRSVRCCFFMLHAEFIWKREKLKHKMKTKLTASHSCCSLRALMLLVKGKHVLKIVGCRQKKQCVRSNVN